MRNVVCCYADKRYTFNFSNRFCFLRQLHCEQHLNHDVTEIVEFLSASNPNFQVIKYKTCYYLTVAPVLIIVPEYFLLETYGFLKGIIV